MTHDEELAALRAKLDSLACSDHGCRLLSAPRGGMGTNGGCHCHRDRTAFVVSQALTARHRQVVLLLAENERLRAIIELDDGERCPECGTTSHRVITPQSMCGCFALDDTGTGRECVLAAGHGGQHSASRGA